MNSTVLRQVLDTLYSSGISDFVLCCESGNTNYKFTLSSNILVEVKDKTTGQEMSTEYSNLESVRLTSMTPTRIEEIRYTGSGLLVEEKKRNIYKEADLLLVLFKILKENAVFVIQNDTTTRVCYYISSRVMYTKCSERVNELVETNLFKLYNSMPGAEMIMFSSLPRRYSCKDFYTEQNQIANRDGKLFRDGKEGVGVR